MTCEWLAGMTCEWLAGVTCEWLTGMTCEWLAGMTCEWLAGATIDTLPIFALRARLGGSAMPASKLAVATLGYQSLRFAQDLAGIKCEPTSGFSLDTLTSL